LRDNNNATTVLFVCVENAGRSQIAGGFFKQYAPKDSRFKVLELNLSHESIQLQYKQ